MIYSVGFCSKQASDLSFQAIYMHVLTLLMYWAFSFAIIASHVIYSVGFCSKQASVTS